MLSFLGSLATRATQAFSLRDSEPQNAGHAFSRQRSTSAVHPKVRLPSAAQRPSLGQMLCQALAHGRCSGNSRSCHRCGEAHTGVKQPGHSPAITSLFDLQNISVAAVPWLDCLLSQPCLVSTPHTVPLLPVSYACSSLLPRVLPCFDWTHAHRSYKT